MSESLAVPKQKIVFIGGGGTARNLGPALRDVYNVTAIVSTFDNGGSYGRLKGVYRSPLSGDVRSALAALSTNDMGALSEFRFDRGDVEGHAFGNLLLTVLHASHENPADAMAKLHTMYGVLGRVLPVSYTLADLQAELMDRTILRGESVIDEPHAKSHVRIRRLWLDPEPVVAPGVIDAIMAADLIIMGPGDIYTSIAPCLLVDGVAKAVMASPARKAYFCNTFTKYGQTNGFPASDHVRAIESYLRPQVFSTVVLNTSPLDEFVVMEAKKKREEPVRHDIDELKKAGYAVISADLLDGRVYDPVAGDALRRSKIKYDGEKLRAVIASLL